MSKDPAFLFYPNDYIGGTMGMTFEEKGAYIELLMLQFNRGHMTKHMIAQTVGQLWDNIEDKFEVDEDGRYFNRRLDEEKTKRQKYVKSRNNNRSGKNQYSKKRKKEVGHMTSHMENENENNIKGGYGGKNLSDKIKRLNQQFLNEVAKDEHKTVIESWKMTMGLSRLEILNRFREFESHLLTEAKLHKNTLELRKHFKNWLNRRNAS